MEQRTQVCVRVGGGGCKKAQYFSRLHGVARIEFCGFGGDYTQGRSEDFQVNRNNFRISGGSHEWRGGGIELDLHPVG